MKTNEELGFALIIYPTETKVPVQPAMDANSLVLLLGEKNGTFRAYAYEWANRKTTFEDEYKVADCVGRGDTAEAALNALALNANHQTWDRSAVARLILEARELLAEKEDTCPSR